jgi:ubiquitin-protein ligase
MAAYESPHIRRLRSDHAALVRLSEESTIFRFQANGSPPRMYVLEFHGKSLAREGDRVIVRSSHQVEVELAAAYPRTPPALRWLTPIYHPNISETGMVCLGAYAAHWAPGVSLADLCVMIWDMARYHNYDIRSPYNRDAALWTAHQRNFTFPVDHRPLADIRASLGRVEPDLERDPNRSSRSLAPLGDIAVVPDLEIRLELDDDDEPSPRGRRPIGADRSEVTFLD